MTETGARISALRNLSDSSIIIVGGRKTTLSAFRDEVRATNLAHLGPPQTFTRGGGVGVDDGSPFGRGRRSLSEKAVSLESSWSRSSAGVLAEKNSSMLPDPDYCKKNPPYVDHVKGKIIPGGYVVVEGGCFGTEGLIRLAGRFDHGFLPLQRQHWDDDSITAAIPQVTGVFDQQVKLQVVRGNVAPNDVGLNFVATRERIPLPAHFITAVQCDQRPAAAHCVNGTGFRMEMGSNWGGTDIWEAHAPPGWDLESLEWRPGVGTLDYGGGFEKGSSEYARWPMVWKAGVERSVTTTNITLGVFVSRSTDYFYGSTYGMTVYANGPAGTMTP